LDDCDVLRFTDLADFYVWADRIVCHVQNPALEHLVEICLLGPVLSFWLERLGVLALHASAVVLNGEAVAFVSSNQRGKTALAAALMQSGCPLLTDDILPVDRRGDSLLGSPGYPTMRMWPTEAQYFLGSYEHLQRVDPDLSKRLVPVGPDAFGAFCDVAQPLACAYVLERRGRPKGTPAIRFSLMSLPDAVMELVRHSFTPYVVEALGWQSRRLDAITHVVQRVPIRRLVFPSGLEHLPSVREAILEDLPTVW
jgi:hypothetical protein